VRIPLAGPGWRRRRGGDRLRVPLRKRRGGRRRQPALVRHPARPPRVSR